MLAVRRVTEDGERPSEVMDSLGLCRTSIYLWLQRYKDQGLEVLVEKVSQGPEPKLSETLIRNFQAPLFNFFTWQCNQRSLLSRKGVSPAHIDLWRHVIGRWVRSTCVWPPFAGSIPADARWHFGPCPGLSGRRCS
jgi:transposase